MTTAPEDQFLVFVCCSFIQAKQRKRNGRDNMSGEPERNETQRD